MVKKLFKSIIEHVKWHDCSRFVIHNLNSRLFEQCQHRTFSLCQMFTRCTMSTNRSKHTSKQVELIWYKWVNVRKIFSVRIQFFLNAIIKQDKILNDCRLIIIKQCKCLFSCFILFKDSFFNNLINIGRRKRKSGIKTSLNL